MSLAVTYLRSTQAIRDRCGQIFERTCQDQSSHFRCNLDQLDRVATYVIEVMQCNYPDLNIPFHSRWRHFEAGDIDRVSRLHLETTDPIERARIKFDLVIPSVLLDAGAGAVWNYRETESGKTFGRSEGLAIASFNLFQSGGFSDPSNPDQSNPDQSNPDQSNPLQSNAIGLQNLTEATFCQHFQVSESNPLIGVDGRLNLMHRLGATMLKQPEKFDPNQTGQYRLGHLVDYLLQSVQHHQLNVNTILTTVLQGLSEIWSGRIVLDGVNLGDVWQHSALPNHAPGSQLVPFHKLSQWLTYSLLEPLQELGLTLLNLDALTGLSEYRNGGLLLDLGLIEPKHDAVLNQAHSPDSEIIVEWRALTVVLLDQLGDRIRQKLNLTAAQFPLAKVLEGGTWAAGRQIAQERRLQGTPPIQIISDGTVF
jgi:Protein of unknown function (DUF1688)